MSLPHYFSDIMTQKKEVSTPSIKNTFKLWAQSGNISTLSHLYTGFIQKVHTSFPKSKSKQANSKNSYPPPIGVCLMEAPMYDNYGFRISGEETKW